MLLWSIKIAGPNWQPLPNLFLAPIKLRHSRLSYLLFCLVRTNRLARRKTGAVLHARNRLLPMSWVCSEHRTASPCSVE